MTKRVIKFLLGGAAMVLAGFGVLQALHFFSPAYQQEKEALRRVQEIQKQYENDTYGGATPEETLQLFIDALKKDDIDLAAKYFVIDKQEEWQKNLKVIKEKNFLQEMKKDLDRERYLHKVSPTLITYSIANEKEEVALTIYMIQASNGIWKIERM